MSLQYPPTGSPLWGKFDPSVFSERRRLYALPNYSAARYATGKEEYRMCIRADASLVLLRVGPKGGCKQVWKFGTIADVPVQSC